MAPVMSPAPRATTQSASTNANWPARWAGVSRMSRADWQISRERHGEHAGPAGLPHRPARLGAAGAAATGLARLAVSGANHAGVAGARGHRRAPAAAVVLARQRPPRPAV